MRRAIGLAFLFGGLAFLAGRWAGLPMLVVALLTPIAAGFGLLTSWSGRDVADDWERRRVARRPGRWRCDNCGRRRRGRVDQPCPTCGHVTVAGVTRSCPTCRQEIHGLASRCTECGTYVPSVDARTRATLRASIGVDEGRPCPDCGATVDFVRLYDPPEEIPGQSRRCPRCGGIGSLQGRESEVYRPSEPEGSDEDSEGADGAEEV